MKYRFWSRLLLAWGFLIAHYCELYGQLQPVKVGDVISVSIPYGNGPENTRPLVNVRPVLRSHPSWMNVKDTSVLPTVTLPPGTAMTFRLDFEVTAPPESGPAEILIEVLTDTPNLNAPRFVWHVRTSNGFLTSSAEVLDEEGNSFGGAVSPDRLPPITDTFFIGPTFVDETGRLFMATHTVLGLEGIDRIIEDAVVSEVAFTGFRVDQAASSISELAPFASTFTLSEGDHFIVFASSDFAGNAEGLRVSSVTVDGTPPGPPVNLLADGANPSPWRNTPAYALSWALPEDVSGIGQAFVRVNGGAEDSTGAVTSFAVDLGPEAVQGATPVQVRLQDNVENADPLQFASVNVRFDNILPSASAVSPSTAAAGPVPVAFRSEELGADDLSPTASGVEESVLWFRRIAAERECATEAGAWERAALDAFPGGGEGAALSEGTFPFAPPLGDGKYCFFVQGRDVAGNLIPNPGPSTSAHASTLFDATPPIVSNVQVPFISSSRAEVTWTTDDETTAVVEYGTSTVFGRKVRLDTFAKSHKAVLDCSLLSPSRVFYRITAKNRTELKTQDAIRSFDTSFDVTVPQDIFGVVDLTQPIELNVTNPFLNSISVSLADGQTLTAAVILPEEVARLKAQLDGVTFNAIFPLERFTAPGELPFAVSGGGEPADSGGSRAEFTIGQAVAGPASDQDPDGALESGGSKLFAGFWPRIDPVAPGAVEDFSALAGPGTGQLTLSWTAPGDDAGVGAAMLYDLRIATLPITEGNFLSAARIAQAPLPALGGQTETLILAGLAEDTTYFFALRALDELLNRSPSSAFADAKTLAPSEPTFEPPPSVTVVELPPGIEEPPPPPVLEVAVGTDTALSGSQTFTVSLNGFTFQTQFVVDTATRSARLARLVVDNAGEAGSGESNVLVSVGQSVVGPPSDASASGLLESPGSRLALGFFAAIDPFAPGAVTDLAAARGPGRGEVTLSWTAAGDDAFAGTAMRYDLRFATSAITEESFAASTRAVLAVLPARAGESQQAVVGGLPDGTTLFFALKVEDELSNFSGLSNAPDIRTFDVAESTVLLAGLPVVELLSGVEGIDIQLVSTTSENPAVALATSAAAAQGLVFASDLFDIISPVEPPLPGGGSVGFRYDDAGLSEEQEQSLRVYRFDVSQGQWNQLADAALDLADNLVVSPVASLSFFALFLPDEEAPVTVVKIDDGRQFISRDRGVFLSTGARIFLSARDPPTARFPGTGVASTEFRLNRTTGPFTPLAFLEPLPTLSEGLNTIQFRSADRAGNVEPVKGAALAVDGAAPVATLSSPDPFRLLADGLAVLAPGPVLVAVELRDPLVAGGPLGAGAGVSTVAFSLNGSSFAVAEVSFTLTLENGFHALALRAEDHVGNLLEQDFRLVAGEVLPPRTALAVGTPTAALEGRTFVRGDTPLSFSSIDDLAEAGDEAGLGVLRQEATINGALRERFENLAPASGQTFLSTLTLAQDPDGPLALGFLAEDVASHRETAQERELWVDNTPPEITVQAPLGGETFVAVLSSIPVAFSVHDAFDPAPSSAAFLVQVENRGLLRGPTVLAVHGGEFVDPLAIDDGLWQLEVRAADFLGNESQAGSGVFEVIHDIQPPRTALAIGASSTSAAALSIPSAGPVTFLRQDTPLNLSSEDDLVEAGDALGLGVAFQEARLGGELKARFENPAPQAGQVFSSTFTLAAEPDGLFELSFFAEDVIGNRETVQVSTVAVDNTAPETQLVLSGPVSRQDTLRFIATRTSVSFTGADMVAGGVASGLDRILFQIDGSLEEVFTSSFTLAEGIRQVARRGADRLGNAEEAKGDELRVDGTPPVTELTPETPFFVDSFGRGFANDFNIYRLQIEDPVVEQVASGVALTRLRIVPLTVAGGVVSEPSAQELAKIPFALFDASTGTFQLNEGAFRPEFKSEDRVLNQELLKSASIFVDATAPESSLAIGAPQFDPGSGKPLVVSTVTPFTLSAVDPEPKGFASGVARTEFRMDGGAFEASSQPFTLSTPDGDKVIGFRSSDNVGNLEAEKTRKVTLDATPPALALLSPPQKLSGVCSIVGGVFPVLGSATDLHFKEFRLEVASGRDASSGFTLISSATVQVSSGSLGVWDTAGLSGFVTLRLSAEDQVGNASSITANVFVGEPKTLLSLGDKTLFNKPHGVAVSAGLDIYVADRNNDKVQVFNSTGALLASFGGKGGEDEDEEAKGGKLLNKPQDVAMDAAGSIYAADTNQNRIVKLSTSGALLLAVGGFKKPSGVALDAAGNIYVSDTNNGKVKVLGPDGALLREFALPPLPPGAGDDDDDGDEEDDDDGDGDGEEDGEDGDDEEEGVPGPRPMGIAVDGAGHIYVADSEGRRALKFDPLGNLLLSIGSRGSGPGQFEKPEGIAVSADGTCILVSDRNLDRVQKFDFLGNLTLVFGKKEALSSEKSPPEAAVFLRPEGLALDAQGNLYVADRNNDRIVRLGIEGDTLIIKGPGKKDDDDDDDGDDEEDEDDENEERHLVQKSRGGKARHSKRKVEVDIPGEALEEDLVVSINPGQEAPEGKVQPGFLPAGLDPEKVQPLGEGVEFGPEGTQFSQPVTITLPYDPASVADESALVVGYWNPVTRQWEPLPSEVDRLAKVVRGRTNHFSLYAVLGPVQPASDFTAGEVYVFPNPAVGGVRPTFHIEVGIADEVKIRVYNMAGQLAHETALYGTPAVIDRGQGSRYAYEYAWEGHIPSGLYLYAIQAVKSGQGELRKTGKFGVVR